MEEVTYSTALREQFRDPEAYLLQLANLFFGLLRILGFWVAITVTYTAATVIIAFIATDLSVYSQGELQEGLRTVVTISGAVAAGMCVLGNVGRFSDVFSSRAMGEVERFKATAERVYSQIDTTEAILVKHGLITQIDVENRRAEMKNKSPLTS